MYSFRGATSEKSIGQHIICRVHNIYIYLYFIRACLTQLDCLKEQTGRMSVCERETEKETLQFLLYPIYFILVYRFTPSPCSKQLIHVQKPNSKRNYYFIIILFIFFFYLTPILIALTFKS